MQFARVIGHASIKARLINNVREGRIPHAQLFIGQRGSGDLALALAYAQYLLCTDPGPADSCGKCPGCQQASKLAHPDLHLAFPIFLSEKTKVCEPFLADWREAVLKQPYVDIDMWREQLSSENKQLRMGVDIAQEIQRKLSLRSFSGGKKIMLIWQPELMDAPASNKLLKVLEEPEPNTVFLLVSSNPDQLLSTIVSRTQITRIPALKPMEVAAEIKLRFPELGDDACEMIGLRSEGDMLEALDLAGKGEEELFVFFRDWLRACFARKVPETAECAEYFQKLGRERQKTLLRYGLHMLRQSTLHWQGVPELVRTMGQEQEFVQNFSKVLNDRKVTVMREEFEQAHHHIERNANPKILFMDMSYRLMGLLKTKA